MTVLFSDIKGIKGKKIFNFRIMIDNNDGSNDNYDGEDGNFDDNVMFLEIGDRYRIYRACLIRIDQL